MKYVNKSYILLVLTGMVIANVVYALFISKDYSSALERSYFQAFLVGVIMLAPKDVCKE